MQFGFDLVKHDLMDIKASLQALHLWFELACRLLKPAVVKALIQVDLELARLKFSLQSQVAKWFFTASQTLIIDFHLVGIGVFFKE